MPEESKDHIWKNSYKPTHIIIPQIYYESEVQVADYLEVSPDLTTLTVPEDGIAIPPEPIENNLFFFGHSQFNGEPREFSNIQNTQLGDYIIVRNEEGELFLFEITGYSLEGELYEVKSYQDMTLTMQTSAKTPGRWILDEKVVLEKVGDNHPPTMNGKLNLIIEAKQKAFD